MRCGPEALGEQAFLVGGSRRLRSLSVVGKAMRWVGTVVVGAMAASCVALVAGDLLSRPGWRPAGVFVAAAALLTVPYAVSYPICRGLRRLTRRGTSKPHPAARTLWRLTLGAVPVFMVLLP